MKPVIKFKTFKDLKSSEKAASDFALSLEKHKDFEKVIMNILSHKVHKTNQAPPKH